MKYLNETGLRHLMEKIRTETRQLRAMIEAGGGGGTLIAKSWSEVQSIVREGLAASSFSVGDQLVCNHSEYGEILWDIVGFDKDTPANGYSHSLTLQAHNLLPVYPFDAREAMVYLEQNLEPGQYWFQLPVEYRPLEGGGEILNFTTDTAIFSGSRLVLNWPDGYIVGSATLELHHYADSPGPIKTFELSYGQAGTQLSNVRTPAYCKGYRYWKESGVRKYLNDSAWQASTVHDMAHMEIPPSFQNGLDADFLAVLGPVYLTEQNRAINDAEQFTDLFFLPSYGEVNGGQGPCEYDNVAYEYYGTEASGTGPQSGRIKTLDGTPSPYFLRTPGSQDEAKVCSVSADGEITETNACTYLGVAPMCCVV